MNIGNLINNHGIWEEEETWINIVRDEILSNIDDNNIKQQLNKKHKKDKKLINEAINKIPKFIRIKILRKIANYTITLKVNPSIITNIINKLAKSYNIEYKDIQDIILDIKMNQTISSYKKDKTPIAIRLIKMAKIRNYCKNSGMIIGISESLKYFDNLQELLQLLRLNKEMKQLLRYKVYRQILLHFHLKHTNPKRAYIWAHMLNYVL